VSGILKKPLLGTAIIGIGETADFDRKNADFAVRVYERLCKGRGLLPPAVGFILDRERRPEGVQAKDDREVVDKKAQE
jgi:hypothetical protein